jgi:acetoin utilization deacetylase AcuC-like enzyme
MQAALPLYYHAIYTEGIHPAAPFPKERYQKVYEGLKRHKAAFDIRTPKPASRAAIEAVHCANYTQRFLDLNLTEKEIRRIGLRPWTPALVERTLLLTGGALGALDALLQEGHRVAANMAGGTHHAHRDFGAGYCIFNDIAICAKHAQHSFNIDQILVVDLDVHQGDGTASIFEHDSSVYTFSMHCDANFPFRKTKSDLDIGLPKETADDFYLATLEKSLIPLADIKPETLFFQAGVDPLQEDHLGLFDLSQEGLMARNKIVLEFAQDLDIPCLVFMGGGYAKPIEHTVEAFINLFIQCSAYNSV